MEETDNPYLAPSSFRENAESFWTRLWRFILNPSFLREPGIREKLLAGNTVVQYGVAFFLDPDDKHLIHAAVPLLNVSDEAIEQNIAEAKRELRKMVQSNEEIKEEVENRMLSVRFISSYQDIEDQVCKPVVTEWYESGAEDLL